MERPDYDYFHYYIDTDTRKQTTAGKADRPALKADTLAADNTGVDN